MPNPSNDESRWDLAGTEMSHHPTLRRTALLVIALTALGAAMPVLGAGQTSPASKDSCDSRKPGRPATAAELRVGAEAADGLRNQDLFLVWRPKGSAHPDSGEYLVVREKKDIDSKKPTKGERQPGDCKVLDLRTNDPEGSDLGKIDSIILKLPKHKLSEKQPEGSIDIVKDGDALVWSVAALDKLVVPYYARFVKLEKLDCIRKAMIEPGVVAALHMRPSEPRAIPMGTEWVNPLLFAYVGPNFDQRLQFLTAEQVVRKRVRNACP